MKSIRSEIERLTPQLRQLARALVEDARADIADELVHDAIADALRWDQGGLVEDVQQRLYARLVAANRIRLRNSLGERRSAPASSNAESKPIADHFRYEGHGDAGTGLDAVPLNEREVLLLVVLGRLNYGQVAEVLGIPMATLIARLARARDSLGGSLWAKSATARTASARPRPAPTHLRLVKS